MKHYRAGIAEGERQEKGNGTGAPEARGGVAERGTKKARGGGCLKIHGETSAASGLGSHLVGCARKNMPLLRKGGGGGDPEKEGPQRCRRQAQIPAWAPPPTFHLGFQVGVPATGGEVFRQSSAGGGESGPQPGPCQPRGGGGGSLLPTGLAAAAGCYQEAQGRRGLAGHADSLQMTCGHGVQLQSAVALLVPFDLAIF